MNSLDFRSVAFLADNASSLAPFSDSNFNTSGVSSSATIANISHEPII